MEKAPAYMLRDVDAFGTFCPVDGTLATRTRDGLTVTDPHCTWNGHRDAIVAALDVIEGERQCPVRWPAGNHFSDHVCAISDLWHEGPHHCGRCDQDFTTT